MRAESKKPRGLGAKRQKPKAERVIPSLAGYGAWLILLLAACGGEDHTPKPRGYFRIDLPEKSYQPYSEACPFEFDMPVYARMVPDTTQDTHPCWMDMTMPEFNASLHLSYWPVNSEEMFRDLTEDARELAYKHTVKASSIDEYAIRFPERDLYGMLYDIKGNTASWLQFYLTDSTDHYLRGALYFREKPRLDSIKPVLDFIHADIDTMIRTFHWRRSGVTWRSPGK